MIIIVRFVMSVMFSAQNHRHEAVNGRVGGGGGLGSHQYLHNTPADYKCDSSALPALSSYILSLCIYVILQTYV